MSCGANVGVSEQVLYGAEISTGVEHVRRAGVPEQVGMNPLLQASASPCVSAEMANRSRIQQTIGALLGRKQPHFGFILSAIDAKSFEQNRRQDDIAGDAAFTLAYVNHHLLAVDIADL